MKTTTRARLRALAGAAWAATFAAACASAWSTTWPVSTAAQLADALAKVEPGDTIALAPGTYRGTFTATRRGGRSRSPARPTRC
jgi:hypothetical protein